VGGAAYAMSGFANMGGVPAQEEPGDGRGESLADDRVIAR